MIKVDQFMNIKELKQQGLSIRDIARMTGHSRNTVRKVLRGEHTLKAKSPERSSRLDPHKDYVRQRYEQHGLSAVRLLAEIVPMGFDGSIATLRRFLRTLKQDVRRNQKLTVRFETPPGKQAQADWAYCGKFPTADGGTISVYAFVMVLSFSRMLFVHFTTSMKMRELIECHQKAFAFFGGWTGSILYDNMKQVRLGPGQWNEQFLDFARHYGFVPKTHRPYRPRTKGKVERAVDYVKDNLLAGRCFHGLEDLNAQALAWLEQTANVRLHGTTQQRPCDLFASETLTPLESMPLYRFLDPVERTANWESMIHFQGSRYSVPPQFAGQAVQVAADAGQIVVRAGDAIIAEHRQATKAGQCIVDKEHLAELWKVTQEQIPSPPHARWQSPERKTQSGSNQVNPRKGDDDHLNNHGAVPLPSTRWVNSK
jgi:transposase